MEEQIKIGGKPPKINRNVLNIIRTTQRNNIDLKHIADNKANILMSINALMITFLFPIVISNLDLILQDYFYIPLSILATTCLVTILLSASVLKPFSSKRKELRATTQGQGKSPFFFNNFDKNSTEEYMNYFRTLASDKETLFRYTIQDLHYYSKVLSLKYKQIKLAYQTFEIGLILSVISMIIIIFMK